MSDVQSVNSSRLSYTSQTNDDNRLGQTGSPGVDPEYVDYLATYTIDRRREIETGRTASGRKLSPEEIKEREGWLQEAYRLAEENNIRIPGITDSESDFQADSKLTDSDITDSKREFWYSDGTTTKIIITAGSINEPRPVIAHIGTATNGLILPNNTTNVKYTYDKDADTLTLEITFQNGAKKTLIYGDVNRTKPPFSLKIDAANPDKVAVGLPEELKGKVNVKQLKNTSSDAGSGERVGDQPTGTEDGADLYDIADSTKPLNISPVKEGSDHRTIVRARGKVTITANSNSEIIVHDYIDGKDIYKIYANEQDFKDKNIKETIEVDSSLLPEGEKPQMDVHPSRVHDNAAGTEHAVEFVSGAEGTGGVSLAAGDTKPTSVKDGVATYQATGNVIITTNYKDGVKTYNVNPQGEVKIIATPQSKVLIEKQPGNPPTYKVTATSPEGETKTYMVQGGDSLKKLIIDGVPPDRISLKGLSTSDASKISFAKAQGDIFGWVFNAYKNVPEQWHAAGPAGNRGRETEKRAQDITKAIGEAVLSGDWGKVKELIGSDDPEHINDVLRRVMTALRRSVGTDADFKQLLKLIDVDVRHLMIDRLREESDSLHEGDGDTTLWDNQGTIEQIESSF